MAHLDIRQYQAKAEAPPNALTTIDQFESDWHQAWSEPVRFKINKRLSIALGASGPFAPVLEPETQIIRFFESRWHQPWSEPKRFKPRLHSALNPFVGSFFDTTPSTSNQLQGWYQSLREPVWPKKGLKRHLQPTHTEPVRYLPPAQVTVVISATETNTDAMEMDVSVYDEITPTPEAIASANVAITEVPVNTEANVSFREREPD